MSDGLEQVTVVVSFVDGTVGMMSLITNQYSRKARAERDGIIAGRRAVLGYLSSDAGALVVKDGKIVSREDAMADSAFAILDAHRKFPEIRRSADDKTIEAEIAKMGTANPVYRRENVAGWRVVSSVDDFPKADRPLWRDAGDAIVVDPGLFPAVMRQIEEGPRDDRESAKKAVVASLTEETRAALREKGML